MGISGLSDPPLLKEALNLATLADCGVSITDPLNPSTSSASCVDSDEMEVDLP